MKRIIALVLSLVMALSLCAPAWGATTVSNAADLRTALETGGDIAVSGTMDATGTKAPFEGYESETVEYYVLGKKVTSITGGTYTMDESAKYGIYVDTAMSEGGNIALSDMKITANSKWSFVIENAASGSVSVSDVEIIAQSGAGLYGVGGKIILDNVKVNHLAFDPAYSDTPWGATALAAAGSADMTINSGTYYGSTYGLYIYNSGATVTINGGTFEAPVVLKADGNYSDGNAAVIGKIVVNDGDFNGEIQANNGNAQIVINGGNFANFAFDNAGWNTRGSLAITGGTFDADPTQWVDSEVATVTKSGDKWVVAKIPDVAEVNGVGYTTLQAALNAGGTVTLLDNITLTEGVTVAAGSTVTLDLNGKTISGTDTTEKNFGLINIDPGATLTISDSVGTGVITLSATTNNGWNRYSSVVSNQRGTLTVNGGTLEHKGGTDMSYAIDNLTNTGAEEAKTVINGGVLKSSYIGIRQFCNSDKGENILEINNGTIEGARCSVWMQNPNDLKNLAKLTITNGFLKGDLLAGSDDFTVAISGGYFTANVSDYVVEGKVVVTSDKEGYPYTVGVKAADTAEVEVAEPVIDVDTTGMTEQEKTAATEVANELKTSNVVEICDDALTAVATEVANETDAAAKTHQVAALEQVVGNVDDDKVEIVVQPYFDIKVVDVEVSGTGSSATVTEVTLNITPMYQLVATTTDVLDNPGEKIDTDTTDGDSANAVKIGNPVVMKIDKPVEITVDLPAAFADKEVYVKHQAEKGVAIYKATADSDGKLTFTTKSGFSPFTFSTTQINAGASVTGGDDYADLQSALNYAGKNAEITVKVKNQSAVVSGEFSFTLKYEGEAKKENTTITAAPGYKLSGPDANGVYTVTKVTGGYYPYYPSTTPDSELVKSPDTFDAGIALYVGVSVMGAIGTVVLGKKRED